MKKNKLVQPFLKWAGGKRQLLPSIKLYIPKTIKTYYEPFLGGGAVLFDLQPKNAVINDINGELINVYRVIKNNVEELIEHLKTYENTEECYYKVRETDRTDDYIKMSDIEKASRIIYLNKTCYNGLFRVNSQGQFNVPFGKYKNPKIVDEFVLKAVSIYLNENNINMINEDFEVILNQADKGSFVYIDPPYDPVSDSSSFTGYTIGGFDRDEQIRLKEACDRLNQRGCKFLLSNSSTPFIRELYNEYKIEIIQANRAINSLSTGRGKIDEVLIRNYE